MAEPRKVYQQNQNISYIAGNVQTLFYQWFLSFFDDDYFKTIRVTTESDFIKFKGFMSEITKHPKPMLVINPDITLVEDSQYTSSFQNRFNSIDGVDIIDKLYTSELLIVLEDFSAEMMFRRSRYRFQFDIMMVESSIITRFDLYNNIINNFRNKSKFTIERKILNIIPPKYLDAIARTLNMDHQSSEFLTLINKRSNYPIVRRKTPRGDYRYYFIEDNLIQVNIPDVPSKDTPEKNNMIINSARVTHIIEFEVTIPSEYFLILDSEGPAKGLKLSKVYSPEMLLYIPPLGNINVDAPNELNGKSKVEMIDVVIENEDEYMINIIDIFEDQAIREMIQANIEANLPLSFLDFKVYRNSIELPLVYDNTGTKIVLEPNIKEAFCIIGYIDNALFNTFKVQYSPSLLSTDNSNPTEIKK